MVAGGFRHLVVVADGEVTGLLSMRDIVRCWSEGNPVAGRLERPFESARR
jgi:signal-transduction protein with cAMP-binding, CBS, and nucleotidyltransferase domain